MQKIPYGQTKTYKQIAEAISRPKAYRAVANACGKNPYPIVVPCHRVVAAGGLGGFSLGIELKKQLLSLEGVTFYGS
jgi:O-6-methylguanine DNA methyltransferase